ncbi:ATP-binding protein [Bacillus paranthracis]|uniref:ATP-binding protein n=1 Tax=Bacillus paranthracis TaxID=2026186 RepID=UPI0021D3B9B4|nr:ATP-binding protein [Bacillus paranthracis]MBR3117796.1 AAA family ATPase [Oceanobacillus sp.]MCU5469550.1 ATP-binding protein [Bacillus paranthracis]
MSLKVTDAQREKLKACIALFGASGGGKTLTSLILAYGMMKEAYPDVPEEEVWKKIGVIDTEHKRSLLYANNTIKGYKIGSFKYVELDAPYSTVRYQQAIELLKKNGCEVIIADSLSHAWEGIGGILDQQQDLGGRFQDWKTMKPVIKEFIKSLTENDVHIIATLRTKQEYQAERDDNDKLQIRKLGLKPIQKDDLEYEFMIVLRMEQNHTATPTKDNSNLINENGELIKPEHGAIIYKWLELGVDVRAEQENERNVLIAQIIEIVESNDEAAKMLDEIEFKTKQKLQDFNLKYLNAALDRLQVFNNKGEK